MKALDAEIAKLEGDVKTGAQIIRKSMTEPLYLIAQNSGMQGDVIIEKVKTLKEGQGLDATTGEYVDMIEAGIIDPVKVTRSALQNASSIAAMILTTDAVGRGQAREEGDHGRYGRRHGRNGRHGLLSPGCESITSAKIKRRGGLTASAPFFRVRGAVDFFSVPRHPHGGEGAGR